MSEILTHHIFCKNVIRVLHVFSIFFNMISKLQVDVETITWHLSLLSLSILDPLENLHMLLFYLCIIDLFLRLMQLSNIILAHLVSSQKANLKQTRV